MLECVGGRRLDAAAAHYVECLPEPGEKAPDAIRVFASLGEARAHVEAYGGELLLGARRPLRHAAFGEWMEGADGR